MAFLLVAKALEELFQINPQYTNGKAQFNRTRKSFESVLSRNLVGLSCFPVKTVGTDIMKQYHVCRRLSRVNR